MILMKDRLRKAMNTKDASVLGEGWNREIKDFIGLAFPINDRAHGIEHAIDVEQTALEISREPEFTHLKVDYTALSAAALLHDIGRAKRDSTWSPDEFEHVAEGAKVAREFLSNLHPFSHNPVLIEKVCYLIFHHDDTNYSFPTMPRCGHPAKALLREQEPEWKLIIPGQALELETLLKILREADARAGTGSMGAKRTLDFSSEERGIRLFADDDGNPLNAWMWQESAIGNVRLAMKRALLDAFTEAGKKYAWTAYLDGEKEVEAVCESKGGNYEPELALQTEALRMCFEKDTDQPIDITRVSTWHELLEELRGIRLRGDPKLFPYAEAEIKSQLIDVESVSPLSLYILSNKLRSQNNLRDALLARYGLDILDMAGILEFKFGQEDEPIRLAPPIIEVYNETASENRGKVWALVDGTHRLALARKKGIRYVRAIVIRKVPERFPLMALPLRWGDVKDYETVPPGLKKRIFRFPTPKDFPDISWFSDVKITDISEDDRPYFFYRDLGPLGSSGPRKPHSKD